MSEIIRAFAIAIPAIFCYTTRMAKRKNQRKEAELEGIASGAPVGEGSQQHEALVAIVGEPNVGKSTLLNKITAQRQALTSNIPGTTRDRFYATTTWNGVDFTLIDTAGIILGGRNENELEKNVQKQVKIALEECDLILYVVDGKQPPQSINRQIMLDIRKKSKPLILAINKIDSPKKIELAAGEHKFTGIKEIYALSAVSGVGLGDMLDAVTKVLAAEGFGKIVKDPESIAVSILGKPNVGKSSLFNQILGEERMVVSNVPGTTRNAVDTDIVYDNQKIKLVDTAGLKRKEKRAPLPDIYAAFQTIRAMHKSEVCIIVIDGKEGITQQDQKIVGDVVDAGKGVVVAINKIDLLSEAEREKLDKNLENYFPFLWWAPVVPISAKSGEGVKDILKYILQIKANRLRKIDDETLNRFFYGKLKERQPQRLKDERIPKVFTLRQVDVDPPVFELTVNKASAIQTQFKRYIQNAIVKKFDFWGTPVMLRLVPKVGNPNEKSMN